MRVLKDIAVAMDCHEKTARRWWKKLRVPPDVRGHGANKWDEASFNRLLELWRLYYTTHGTTPQIIRLKYAGKLTDKSQLELLTWTPKATHEKSISSAKKRNQPGRTARRIQTTAPA